ncbi:hypothetical protein CMI37_36600 [Candidatus Pacearchaeota archaeon]|nr:hypothetical protein [Candidatus Pacearchaeota archaeon]|tara:strand:- start:280 stop:474 length:195 start_codon:yes stop_codon:yes gene_type:complete
MINENKMVSRFYVANFYEEQLKKFKKLGMGKETENGVIITPTLIKVTKKRLGELRKIYRKNNEI